MQWELAGSSLGVRQRNQEGCWEHAGRSPKEDCKTHRKITGGCRIAWSLDDAVEPYREFARRFIKGIGKLAGNIPGDRRKKTIGLTARMPETTGLGGS
ncbi:hypothetical protein B296_00030738 [Ensete ventricosum]|uniref:Uncharacterized protein n=1 Tax=Ensete ventricosum TaxID=4639 RepID=A0A426XVX2_ENSVE|nr:hypothetical protein B296_00030738 [Ensete ventricosum]